MRSSSHMPAHLALILLALALFPGAAPGVPAGGEKESGGAAESASESSAAGDSRDFPLRAPAPIPASEIWRVGLSALSARVSPDGTQAAFVLAAPARGGRIAESWLWVYTRAEDSRSRLVRGLAPEWAPGGKSIALLAPDKSGYQLATIAPDGRIERRLTTLPAGLPLPSVGPVFAWSRASDRIVFIHNETAAAPEPAPKPPIEPAADPAPGEAADESEPEKAAPAPARRVGRLSRVNLADGSTETLLEIEGRILSCLASPDDKWIALALQESASPSGPAVRLFSVESKSLSPSSAANAPAIAAGFSPDGARLAVLELAIDPGAPIFSRPFTLAMEKPGGLRTKFALDRHALEPAAWLPEGRALNLALASGAGSRLFRVDLEKSSAEPLAPDSAAPGALWEPHLSADGQWMTALGDEFDRPAEVWLMKSDGTARERLTSGRRRAEEFALGAGERFEWDSREGAKLAGALIKPSGFSAEKRYPLVVDLAPGPAPLERRFNAHWQFFAGRSTAVFAPEHRLAGLYGRKLAADAIELGYEGRMGAAAEDVVAGVKALVARGLADPDRIYLRGQGFGAELAAWILARSPLFAGAALIDPPSLPPAQDHERITKPVLFLFSAEGDAERGARRLALALSSRRVRSEVVLLGGPGRGLHHPDSQARLAEAALEWFSAPSPSPR